MVNISSFADYMVSVTTSKQYHVRVKNSLSSYVITEFQYILKCSNKILLMDTEMESLVIFICDKIVYFL